MNRHLFRPAWNGFAIGALLVLLSGCAVAPSPTGPSGDFRDRSQTQSVKGIRVEAAVPGKKETRDLFGKPLYSRGIQPVWVRIENTGEETLTFLPVGLDPLYYSPHEVAHIDLKEAEGSANLVNDFFIEQGMSLLVTPGETRSGFIFTRLDEGTKSFNVDISTESDFHTFTFFIPVPGLRVDHYDVDWKNLWPDDAWKELDTAELIAFLQSSPCCVTDKSGENTGDPLNLVVIGHPRDVYTAFIRADWDETETVTTSSAWKTVKSFMSGGDYRYSPVSALYVFDRPQDVAFQWTRDSIHERNHLRLWMSHYTYGGEPVWLGQISRDIGVRFTRKTITTHKIDPDVDETREYLLENLAYAQSLEAAAYVEGVGAVPIDSPRGNLTGDPWFTDGYRLVLWVSPEPVPLSGIQFRQWANPHAGADVTSSTNKENEE